MMVDNQYKVWVCGIIIFLWILIFYNMNKMEDIKCEFDIIIILTLQFWSP